MTTPVATKKIGVEIAAARPENVPHTKIAAKIRHNAPSPTPPPHFDCYLFVAGTRSPLLDVNIWAELFSTPGSQSSRRLRTMAESSQSGRSGEAGRAGAVGAVGRLLWITAPTTSSTPPGHREVAFEH
jgi:hypothetical protein